MALLFVVASVLGGLILEVGARAIVSLQVGPSIFAYGLRPERDERNVAIHDNWAEGRYSKYFPHQVKTDTDITGEQFEIVMNSSGFRGEDFADTKEPGAIRILTLGASSTFGYHSRETETYPAQLEAILNERCDRHRFDVINLGIPHLDAQQIFALLVEEGLPLDPDIITFYEGINDSEGGSWRAPKRPSAFQRIRTFVRKKFVVALLLKNALTSDPGSSAAQIEAEAREKAKGFFAGLEAIRAAAEENEIAFYVATQQAKSSLLASADIRGLSYAEEVAMVEERLAADATVRAPEKVLLIHDQLMEGLHAWAGKAGIPLIDVIKALDDRRDTLVSWVHLSPEGNEIIAEAFHERIATDWCGRG